jgi:hypothetical protein
MRRMKPSLRPVFLALFAIVTFATAAAALSESPKPAPADPAPAAVPAPDANAPAAAGAAPAAAGEMAPDKVVESYLKAMQAKNFPEAFKYVSTTLKAGKTVELWSKEQQYIMDMGEVKIIDFKVYPAIVGKDGVARVPNILKSQDKFLNQLGLDEHEIYELIKENGAWKIDQQTLAEGQDRAEYFPDDAQKR